MSYEASPYFIDGHFCRFAETTTSTCNPFYSQNKNDFTSLNSAVFGVGNKGYVQCQENNARASDTFSFLPNNWVFDAYDKNSGDIKLVVTAVLDECDTGRRRMLQRGLVAEVPQVVKGDAVFNLAPKIPDDNSDTDSGAATSLTALFLASSLLLV